jgi:dephospho-CoA kinase
MGGPDFVPKRALHWGVTGGIGSGKSTVCAMLHQRGAAVVDADAISRSLTAPGGGAMGEIKSLFGPQALDAQGGMDRQRMRALVFSNSQAKQQIEAIIHPLVAHAIAHQAQQAEQAGISCIVYDIPLLVESAHWRKTLHRVLVVDCSESTQIERVVRRSGLSRTEILKIIHAQAPRARRLAAADAVICNENVDLDALALQVLQLTKHFGL